jgi:hypothetical protein
MTDTIRIKNIENYDVVVSNGEMVISPKPENIRTLQKSKRVYVSESYLRDLNLIKSHIIHCCVKSEDGRIKIKETKYQTLLFEILRHMTRDDIIENSGLNVSKKNMEGRKGYRWVEKLGLSVQSKNPNGYMLAILNIIFRYEMSINICIVLCNGNIINYKNY